MSCTEFLISEETPKNISSLIQSLPVRRFSVDEYHKMGELGILSEYERVELIEGIIIQMSPIGSKHAGTVKNLARIFYSKLPPSQAMLGIQDPVVLDDGTEPEPDISILKPRDDTYTDEHPHPSDVLLVVEIADASVENDRAIKLPRYAAAGIPEAWLVNIPERCIETYHIPIGEKEDADYKIRTKYREGETLSPKAFLDVKIDVADVLPKARN